MHVSSCANHCLSVLKDVYALTPESCEDVLLSGIRDFAEITKVIDLKTGRQSCVIWTVTI